ncbi:nucleotide sugar dehydrogenase [Streptomyces sp. NPDC021093]|uniref:nucleotide sugar dehydrogenase n=1 Tax=Streptomyces sp. NPDC021093 TaxID=3365112 RepID=UPI00379B5CF4
MKVVVIGQGYVGLPLAVRAAETGHTVFGLEIDQERTEKLATGQSYIEDIPDAQLCKVIETGRYIPTCDPAVLQDFDVAVITVPTPLRDGAPDLGFVEEAAGTIAKYLNRGATVIVESTTYPGTTDGVVRPLLEEASGLTAEEDFYLGFSPERIDPGNPKWGFVNTPKIVSGTGSRSLAALQDFYTPLVERTVPLSGTKEGEFTKLIENTFRAVNIALVNELADAAHALDIDVWESLEAAATKPFGFMKFTPGPGVGGHCLPIDPEYLSWRLRQKTGEELQFWSLARKIASRRPAQVVQRLSEGLNRQGKAVNGSTVLLLGLAYKANVSDCRESPALRVAELLLSLGAEVRAVDPWVPGNFPVPTGVHRVDASGTEFRNADAVVLLTDHEGIDYDLLCVEAAYVLDCRNRLKRGRTVETI